MARGLFISFEGSDGAGKSTQVRLLADQLAIAREVVVIHEPGGTEVGEQLRTILKGIPWDQQAPWFAPLLVNASRSQAVDKVVRPALARGAVVISDRFFDSTYAYQGYGDGLDIDLLKRLTVAVCGQIIPDITFYLELPRSVSAKRRLLRGKPEDLGDLNDPFLDRANHGFRQLAAADPARIKVVDADRSAEVVAGEILSAVEEKLLGFGLD